MAGKPKLLLHACCGPCATVAVERLSKDYSITCYFHNPNIFPEEEYERRLDTLKTFARHADVEVIEGERDFEGFTLLAAARASEPEGGRRCALCFDMRLERTALAAEERGFGFFATTLTASPHKNAELINETGRRFSEQYGPSYVKTDLKKKDGFRRSVEISKKLNLYRQTYCGCRYSMPDQGTVAK